MKRRNFNKSIVGMLCFPLLSNNKPIDNKCIDDELVDSEFLDDRLTSISIRTTYDIVNSITLYLKDGHIEEHSNKWNKSEKSWILINESINVHPKNNKYVKYKKEQNEEPERHNILGHPTFSYKLCNIKINFYNGEFSCFIFSDDKQHTQYHLTITGLRHVRVIV